MIEWTRVVCVENSMNFLEDELLRRVVLFIYQIFKFDI